MPGVTLDTGALIAVERASPRMQALLEEAHLAGLPIDIPAGALAQAWRGAPRQARLARLLRLSNVSIRPLDETNAKAAGALCGHTASNDPIDASIVINARRNHHTIITSDPDDLHHLDPTLRIIAI